MNRSSLYVAQVAAIVAHEVNRAYCQSLGDMSQVVWDEAPEWQRSSSLMGALAVVDGAITNPGDAHRSWMEQKVSEGWTYGDVKDADAKTHPCMVPFEQLPAEQQTKDLLFLATVRGVQRAMNVREEEGAA